MSVLVEQIYSIKIDAQKPWLVSSDCIKRVNGVDFVKLRPYDRGFLRVVCGDIVDIPKSTRVTVAQSDGFKAIVALRNVAIEAEEPEKPITVVDRLFGAGKAKEEKKSKLTAGKLAELRECPEVSELDLPEAASAPAVSILVLKPIHPCDDLYVKCDTSTLDAVVCFVRSHGLCTDTLMDKRHYNKGGGVWRMGSAGLVQPLAKEADDEGENAAGHRKRFKICKHDKSDASDSPAACDADASELGVSEADA